MTDSNEFDTTEKVERTDIGYRLTVESTRGTGTRDQDKVKAESRTETLQELAEDRESLCRMVEATMARRRKHQPDEPEGEE
jgi:hypothetical protein